MIDYNPKEAIITANRIKSTIKNQNILVKSHQINLTVSIGVGVYSDRDQNLNQTISRVDKALYEAKNSGRNRVIAINS